jgi:hypothetical protein
LIGDHPTLCRVEVIKSDVDRLLDLVRADVLRDLPGTESDLRDLPPVVQLDRLEWHLLWLDAHAECR